MSTSSTLHSALTELLRDGIVEESGKTYRVGDPFLARYARSSLGTVIP